MFLLKIVYAGSALRNRGPRSERFHNFLARCPSGAAGFLESRPFLVRFGPGLGVGPILMGNAEFRYLDLIFLLSMNLF